MAKTYTLNVAGLTRELTICKVNDHMDIAAFIMLGDAELTVAAAAELLKKCPEFDILLTAEAKGIPLAHEMSRQSGKPYVCARKGEKLYMTDPVVVEDQSITTAGKQKLVIDRKELDKMNGKRVLVLLTDMTNFADAQKEMAITMEQVPSNRGYPGDLYSCLAARYEKAVDFEGAGSITILGVTTMPGDDVTHPVPDNTGYITEGQYYLKNGHIEPFGSLSRLKQNVNGKTRSDHRALMDGMIRLYSAYKESLEKKSMGFMMSEWDEKLLKYGHLFETKLMDLSVNIPLEEALDLGWEILAECFEPNETGLKTSLIQERWPKRDAVE